MPYNNKKNTVQYLSKFIGKCLRKKVYSVLNVEKEKSRSLPCIVLLLLENDYYPQHFFLLNTCMAIIIIINTNIKIFIYFASIGLWSINEPLKYCIWRHGHGNLLQSNNKRNILTNNIMTCNDQVHECYMIYNKVPLM